MGQKPIYGAKTHSFYNILLTLVNLSFPYIGEQTNGNSMEF